MDSDSAPLYQQLKDSLRRDMESGRLSPGQRIPSERLLSSLHGVSRITVKKAVSDLMTEGWLEHLESRKGTFVRRRTSGGDAPGFIAVAIDDVREPFGAQILRGIEDFLWGRRIHTLICNADRDLVKVEEYFRSLLRLDISGVIFAPVIDKGYRDSNRRLVSILEASRIPFTLVDRYIPGLLANYVGANHEESSRGITEHLIRQGHRRILLARGLECTSMEERVQGYRNALSEAGIPVDERLIVDVNDNLLEAGSAETLGMEGQIRDAGDFTCFYALNDRLFRAGLPVVESISSETRKTIELAAHNEVGLPHPRR
ncbi:MAG TPA: GntR family transcriptional regulator, partial [Spirochaetia bacterium]|nr:GntR family transcriptional regulator [Spirochaetia bacterium]